MLFINNSFFGKRLLSVKIKTVIKIINANKRSNSYGYYY
jgi:hypothetical protein